MTYSCHIPDAILFFEGAYMKIDRLIGILSVLLQQETVTAPSLAERFEVSGRTINRDIEDLCKAGIPIVTRRGAGGGISIMENYKIDRTVLTTREMQDILAGLRSLDSVSGTNQYGLLMEKLSAGGSDFMTGDQSVLIDLSSWYKDTLSPKIEIIRDAIEGGKELEFLYFSPKKESRRRLEPYYLIFRWSSWYVWGRKASGQDLSCTDRCGTQRCPDCQDFRLFKLNRMEELRLSGKCFEKQKVPLPDLRNERIFPGGIRVKVVFAAECKWRLVEEFGRDCFEEQEDGRLLFHADYTDKDNLISWLLTFGDRVTLQEPESIREELRKIIEAMRENYETV